MSVLSRIEDVEQGDGEKLSYKGVGRPSLPRDNCAIPGTPSPEL